MYDKAVLFAAPNISTKAPTQVQNQKRSSLTINGPRLSNLLPAKSRNMSICTTDVFRQNLDRYIATIPDEPQVPEYATHRGASLISLLDMVRLDTALFGNGRQFSLSPEAAADGHLVNGPRNFHKHHK